MDTQWTLLAFLQLWPEMPRLLGASWLAAFPRYRDLLQRIGSCQDAGTRDWLVADLSDLLTEDDSVRERFFEVREIVGRDRERGQGDPPPVPPGWDALGTGIDQRLQPPTTTRYTDISAPRRLTRGSRGVIVARLTRRPEPGSVRTRELELRLDEPVEVHCHASPGAFEIPEPVAVLNIAPEADSPSAVFYVTALREGMETVRLDFHQSGQLAGTAAVDIQVVPEEVAGDLQSVEARFHTGGPYAPPADLEIHVVWDVRSPRELRFVLHSPTGAVPFTRLSTGPVPLPGEPEQFQREFLRKIEDIDAGRDGEGRRLQPEDVPKKLRAVGQGLYGQLFSTEMHTHYKQFRNKVKTLQLTSDEPWIPWEILKPYDYDDEEIARDDFLCLKFQMTRWLAGQSAPAGEVRVSSLACVSSPSLSDEKGEGERTFFANLIAKHPQLTDKSPAPPTPSQVKALMEKGGVDLWHFATHGDANPSRIEEALIYLEPKDKGVLKAEELSGDLVVRIRKDRPLVFMNACRVGRQGWSLTRLGGWVTAWINHCQCGLFVGPLWAVGNSSAGRMAALFYEALQQGQTAGEAARIARRAVRHEFPAKATWLAYSFYANPNARVWLPTSASVTPS